MKTKIKKVRTWNQCHRTRTVGGSTLENGRSRALETTTPPTAMQAAREDRLGFPLDLGEWVDRKVLLRITKELIASLNWSNPALVSYLKAHPAYRPRELLALLTYAYATGTFESEVIAEKLHTDDAYRSIAGATLHTSKSIARFRRENRELLQLVLAGLLKEAVRQKHSMRDTLLPPSLGRSIEEVAVERLDLARHMDRAVQEM